MDALKEANDKLLSASGDPALIRGALEARDRHNGLAAQRIAEVMAHVEKLQDENAELRIDLHKMKEVGGACDEFLREHSPSKGLGDFLTILIKDYMNRKTLSDKMDRVELLVRQLVDECKHAHP